MDFITGHWWSSQTSALFSPQTLLFPASAFLETPLPPCYLAAQPAVTSVFMKDICNTLQFLRVFEVVHQETRGRPIIYFKYYGNIFTGPRNYGMDDLGSFLFPHPIQYLHSERTMAYWKWGGEGRLMKGVYSSRVRWHPCTGTSGQNKIELLPWVQILFILKLFIKNMFAGHNFCILCVQHKHAVNTCTKHTLILIVPFPIYPSPTISWSLPHLKKSCIPS